MSTAVKYYAFLYVIMFPEFALFLFIILLFGDEFWTLRDSVCVCLF